MPEYLRKFRPPCGSSTVHRRSPVRKPADIADTAAAFGPWIAEIRSYGNVPFAGRAMRCTRGWHRTGRNEALSAGIDNGIETLQRPSTEQFQGAWVREDHPGH